MSAAVAKDATGKSASYLIGLDDQPGAALLAARRMAVTSSRRPRLMVQ